MADLPQPLPRIRFRLVYKIIALLALVIGIIVSVIVYFSIDNYKRSMYEQLLNRSALNVQSLVSQITPVIELKHTQRRPKPLARVFFARLFQTTIELDDSIDYFAFHFNPDLSYKDNAIYGSDDPVMFYPLTYAGREQAGQTGGEDPENIEYFSCFYNRGLATLEFYYRIYDNRGNDHGLLMMGVSTAKIRAGIRHTLMTGVLTGFAVMGLGTFLSFVFTRIVLRPVNRLDRTARQIAGGALSKRVPITTSDEIAQLSYSFNTMTRNLEKKINDLNALQLLSMGISQQLNQKELLNVIVSTFQTFAHATHAALFLFDNENLGFYHLGAGLNLVVKDEVLLDVQEGLLNKVLVAGEITVADTTEEFPELRIFFAAGQKPETPCRVLAVPFTAGDETQAVLYLAGPEISTDVENFDIYNLLGNHALVAIENAHLYSLAITDGLTGLYLKRHFLYLLEQEIKKAIASNEPFTLMMTDIDHFKAVNDTYGHREGDIVLKEVARRIKKATRCYDIKQALRAPDIVGRYGGEEFCVLCLNSGVENAARLAERIRAGVAQEPITGEKHVHNITISIGACVFKRGLTAAALIEAADQALYAAKHDGRNCCRVAQP